MREYYRVQANINLDAIYENVLQAKKLLSGHTAFMAVIKADGYGHGAVEIAHTVDGLVDAYGVAIPEEGIELRRAGIDKPILILGVTVWEQFEEMLAYDLSAALVSGEMAQKMSKAGVCAGKKMKVHIKLDTGMSRIGFALSDKSLSELVDISKLPGIQLEGCFSHFARMDEKDKTTAERQLTKFLGFTKSLEDRGVALPVKHISNSAGIIEMPEAQLDMVRDGICLYGLYPSEEVVKERLPLVPAMELKAYVSFVKELEAGVEIGYGGTYVTSGKTKVATIPVGYADGYPRALSGVGHVLIHGKRAPILGRVCMDQFMVDVTGLDEVKPGDVVTLVGRDGEEFLPVEELAGQAHSFNYEFVCDVGKRVPRVFYRNGQRVATRDFYLGY